MASINLLLQSKNSPAVIYVRLRDARTLDINAKTNYHIDIDNWEEAEQRPTKKAMKLIDFANLDTDLATLKNDLLKEYNKSKGVKVVDALLEKPVKLTTTFQCKLTTSSGAN